MRLIGYVNSDNVYYIHFANTRLNITRQFLSGVLHGNHSFSFMLSFIRSFFTKEYVISIGSIIQAHGSSRCIVWGSGIMNRNDKINRSTFLAVRGEYTKSLIKKMGFNEPRVIGDSAILLPLIYSPVVTKKYRLGIIPHQFHYDTVKKHSFSDDILIIKLNTPNIEKVVNDICSCEYTISTSLHGIIVSHAYNIKSLWFKYEDIPLSGDDVKFLDYFSSVEIPEYKPFILTLNKQIDSKEIINTILNFDRINQINVNIKFIQKQLIDVAPFPIKPKFHVY